MTDSGLPYSGLGMGREGIVPTSIYGRKDINKQKMTWATAVYENIEKSYKKLEVPTSVLSVVVNRTSVVLFRSVYWHGSSSSDQPVLGPTEGLLFWFHSVLGDYSCRGRPLRLICLPRYVFEDMLVVQNERKGIGQKVTLLQTYRNGSKLTILVEPLWQSHSCSRWKWNRLVSLGDEQAFPQESNREVVYEVPTLLSRQTGLLLSLQITPTPPSVRLLWVRSWIDITFIPKKKKEK